MGEEDMARWHIASASHVHQRTADSGKRRGGAGQAEGGSGDRGGRRPPSGLTLARGRRSLTSKAIFTGKIKLGCQGFLAELILGCAGK
jgi:hypothetical protein